MSNSSPIDHTLWDLLLKKHIDDNGLVDYEGFISDSTQLNEYLNLISSNAPNLKSWNENERLAYWINAYNAFTIKLIINHYPVKSIKDIGPSIQIPFMLSPWDIKFIDIGKETYDLNNIEHNIIREKFHEPRIHFALVCAALSCPRLRNEAYHADRLDFQLDDQASLFINNIDKNKIAKEEIKISKIFRWYGGDFKKNGSTLTSFLNRYTNKSIDESTSISYLDYDWSLNRKQQ